MAPLPIGTGTTDQADLVKLDSAQLNLVLLHSTLVRQLPITEHKIDRHWGRSWKRQRPLDKTHDDANDDDDIVSRLQGPNLRRRQSLGRSNVIVIRIHTADDSRSRSVKSFPSL